jgi:diguanylate cyclase (GGDEF)-like protein
MNGTNMEKYLLSLESLLDISILLNSELDYSEVIQSAILTCLGQVTAKYGLIYIKKPMHHDYELSYSKGIENSNDTIQIIPEDADMIQVFSEKKNPVTYKKGLNETLDKVDPQVVLPLVARERLIGVMALGEKYFGTYSEEDMEFLNKFGMITANAVENSLLYSLATKDTKTGLYLHHYFMNRLKEEVYKCQRYKNSVAVVMIDLDHFKKINDQYGHQAGDYVLEKLGSIITDYVRSSDLPCRFGGEEFSILLPNTAESGGLKFASRLRELIEETEFTFQKKNIPVTASMGVCEYQEGIDAKGLIENADKALYLAKESGRNLVLTYSDYLREKE